MRSKLCAMTARTPSNAVPFAAQSRELPVPYSWPARTIEVHAFLLVLHGRVVNAHPRVVRLMHRHAAFDAGHHEVLDAHVGEGAANHHAVVAAARAVAIEVLDRDALLDQINAGGRSGLDRPGRTDVIGGDRIAENGQRARVADLAESARASWRNLRRTAAPGCKWRPDPIRKARRSSSGLFPQRILLLEVGVELLECLRAEGGLHHGAHFRRLGQISLQENVLAIGRLADRLLRQIDIDPTSERERDDQRRAHQEIRLDALMDARFEIAIARKHRSRDEIVAGNGLFDCGIERAGVADACRAAVADNVEAELIEVWLKPVLRSIR